MSSAVYVSVLVMTCADERPEMTMPCQKEKNTTACMRACTGSGGRTRGSRAPVHPYAGDRRLREAPDEAVADFRAHLDDDELAERPQRRELVAQLVVELRRQCAE